MNTLKTRTWLPIALALLLVSCATMSNEDIGGVVGAAVGAAAGAKIADDDHQVVGAFVGAVIGGLAGRKIGAYMDDRDRQRTAQALENSRTGTRTAWVNPDSGIRYAVTPTRTYSNSSGAACRDFDFEKSAGLQHPAEQMSTSACRDKAGVWHSS